MEDSNKINIRARVGVERRGIYPDGRGVATGTGGNKSAQITETAHSRPRFGLFGPRVPLGYHPLPLRGIQAQMF